MDFSFLTNLLEYMASAELWRQVANTFKWIVAAFVVPMIGVSIYVRFTEYDDFKLIRDGNVGVTINMLGVYFGLLFPILAVAASSSKVVEMIPWALIALVIQIGWLFAEAYLWRGMRSIMVQSEDANRSVSCGLWLAGQSVGFGLILAVVLIT